MERNIIQVEVLGPVEVRGGSRPFGRPWSRELVVYLALHPRGAATEDWATALWPDRRMAASTLHSTVSAARRGLGCTADGLDHLPRGRGRLRLADSVVTDWTRLRTLAAGGHSDRWRALELVRGQPFKGLRCLDWPVMEGFVADIEETVVDLACAVGEEELAHGHEIGARRAARAARSGLRAAPLDERLYRLLLRAADALGNRAGLRSLMRELVCLSGEPVRVGGTSVRAGEGSVGDLDCLHPSTVALYRQLSGKGGSGRPPGARAGPRSATG